MTDDQEAPDTVPMGMEIEYYADTHDLPLASWQRRILLQMFPKPAGEEQPKIRLTFNFRRGR